MNTRSLAFISLLLPVLLPAHPLVAETVSESQNLGEAGCVGTFPALPWRFLAFR